MLDEYPQETGSSDDSTPLTGEENEEVVDENTEPEDQPIEEEVVQPQTPSRQPVAATAPAAPVAEPPAQQAQGFATVRDVQMPDILRSELSTFLSEDAMRAFDSYVDQKAEARAQHSWQSRDAQEEQAQSLGIPASYLPSVRRFMPQAQQVAQDPKQAALIAVQMDLHERAVKNGGNLQEEMRKYLAAANPEPVSEPTAPPAPTPRPRVQALHPDAQPTRSAIQGTPIREPVAATNRRRPSQDPLVSHFPWAKEEE